MTDPTSTTQNDDQYETDDTGPAQAVEAALNDADNVVGAEFLPPQDLNGYLDEPTAAFGLWVGENESEADLHTFELTGIEQIQGMADVFEKLAADAQELVNEDESA